MFGEGMSSCPHVLRLSPKLRGWWRGEEMGGREAMHEQAGERHGAIEDPRESPINF